MTLRSKVKVSIPRICMHGFKSELILVRVFIFGTIIVIGLEMKTIAVNLKHDLGLICQGQRSFNSVCLLVYCL